MRRSKWQHPSWICHCNFFDRLGCKLQFGEWKFGVAIRAFVSVQESGRDHAAAEVSPAHLFEEEEGQRSKISQWGERESVDGNNTICCADGSWRLLRRYLPWVNITPQFLHVRQSAFCTAMWHSSQRWTTTKATANNTFYMSRYDIYTFIYIKIIFSH